ncbi:MAG: NRAMP family divalent metal transporter [Acidimicrobiales bacterium]
MELVDLLRRGPLRSSAVRRSVPAGPDAPGAGGAPGSSPARGRRPRSLWRRMVFIAAIAGPGLIAANAGNDAGGIATYASAGSQYRYRALFVMVLITVGLVVVQEMSARLGAITGKGLAALIREEFSIRMASVALSALLVANVGIVVSEFAGIGAAFELFGVSRYLSVPLAAVAIWVLVLFGTYRYAERVFLLLSLAFLAYPIAAGFGHPNWSEVGINSVLPHFEASKGFVLLVVALIGTTISPYMQLYNAAAVVDRGIGPEEYPIERIDTVAGAIFADLISWFIIVATAAAIGGRGALTSAREAALALRPVAGHAAEILFGLGLLGASALAGAVVPLSTSYALAEAIGVERSVSRRFREAPLFLGLFTAQVVIGAVVALVPVNLISLLIGTQVLQGILTPITLVFILTLANRRSLLGSHANGPIFRVVATISVAVVAVMAAGLVVLTVLGWLGI